MKWIKLFEAFDNEYYQEISEEEYEDGHGVLVSLELGSCVYQKLRLLEI